MAKKTYGGQENDNDPYGRPERGKPAQEMPKRLANHSVYHEGTIKEGLISRLWNRKK